MVRRRGACAGDGLWVTGTIGDGALGLLAIRGELDDPDGHLAARYRVPQPRLGLVRPGLVGACMDVSDGLVQDLGHLCRASGVGADVLAEAVPRSGGADWLETCLTGGDDYELLMAVAPDREASLEAAASALGFPVTRIGSVVRTAAVRVLDGAGEVMRFARGGYSHF
jgi:thiamine-monophosphate kinase